MGLVYNKAFILKNCSLILRYCLSKMTIKTASHSYHNRIFIGKHITLPLQEEEKRKSMEIKMKMIIQIKSVGFKRNQNIKECSKSTFLQKNLVSALLRTADTIF
uniref:Uncharacterized protein n=1 Tax=Micrurus paraensis TaxID=1970185 RepID=A0A2D4L522_9SAUR